MKLAAFIQSMQAYYRLSYHDGQKAALVKYLSGIQEDELELTHDQVLADYTTAYSKEPQLPDIAVIARARGEIQDELAAQRMKRRAVLMLEDHEPLADPEVVAAAFAQVNKIFKREIMKGEA